jgi:hypothetical protein
MFVNLLRRRKHDGSAKAPYRNAEIAAQSHKAGRDSRDSGLGEVDNVARRIVDRRVLHLIKMWG